MRKPLTIHRATLLLAAAMILAIIPSADTDAQYRVGSGGAALDRNLRVGGGGYNHPARRPHALEHQRYTVGSSKPLYVTTSDGRMVYSHHNAFNPTARYTATGYTGNYLSTQSYRRFRYSR